MPLPEATTGIIAPNSGGILQVATNAQLIDFEKRREDLQKAQQEQNKPEVLALAAHIRKCWEAAKRGKVEIEERLLKCMRQRKGVYDPEDLIKIRQHGGSEIYMMLTSMKCRAAEAWIRDIMIPPGEKPWSLDPTPKPEMPFDLEDQIAQIVEQEATEMIIQQGIDAITVEQITARLQELRDDVHKEQMEDAKHVTLRMETEIEDELVEGNYYEALSEFIEDLVTFPAAFLKGPLIKKRKVLTWGEGENGQPEPIVTEEIRKDYERVSPFDIYPSPGAKNIQDGYCIERQRLRRSDLQKLIGVPGYKEAAIRGVLWEYGIGGMKDWLWTDQEKQDAENKPQFQDDPEPIIDGLLFSGNAQGKMLLEWGMTKEQVPDPDLDYEISALVIGNWVPMARINPHPLGRRNYYTACYDEMNDSIWGRALPELMRDIAKVCNASARHLVNNLAISSGPLVEAQTDRLAPGENIENLYPWKIIKTKSDAQGRNRNAIQFYQPNINADALMNVYDYFFKQASEVTGIPAYMYGSEKVGGAGKTASGLSMLMNAATKTLKGVIKHVDSGVIIPSINEHWLTLMLYDNEIEKTGDIAVIARASEYLIVAEQLQVRRTEFLVNTANPIDLQIMGIEGRAAVLRETVKALKMPTEDIVPSKKDMEERKQLMMQQPQGGSPGQGGEAEVLPGGQKAGQVEG